MLPMLLTVSGQTACARGGEGGELTEKFLAIGDSSPPQYLAKTRGTSASRS